jgi:putative acetyltransferase
VIARFQEVVSSAREVWVTETSGQAVGLMVLDDGWIDQLCVHPAWTGRRLGSGLVDLAKRERLRLDLWTFESNVGARRFYERHGSSRWDQPTGNEEGK